MTKEQRRAHALKCIEQAERAVHDYLDYASTQDERIRLLGLAPDLSAALAQFRNATAPDEEDA